MRKFRGLLLGMALAGAAPVSAQGGSAPLRAAGTAKAECVALAEDPSAGRAEARAAYERARRAFEAVVAAEPRNPDAHAGLGETLSRCGAPLAGMTSILGVVQASSESLERALALDPQHWVARYVLAMNHFNMPAFLNRSGDAIRHLEILAAQQAGRNDRPEFALVHLRLGEAYARVGRAADARAAYALGARLFPNQDTLRLRADRTGSTAGAGADAAGGADATAGAHDAAGLPGAVAAAADGSRPYALAPLRVEVSQHQLEGARSGTSLGRVDVYTMPGGTGEMLQTLQSLPGVTRAGDGADLYVRGGDPEETPVFVNGGRLAHPGRWEGLGGSTMGVLDASVLSRAYFSPGGFSAKYGNALSGVVDVDSRGRPDQPQTRLGVNLVSVGGGLFRPLGESAGAWGTAMLTDVRLLTRLHGIAAEYPDAPRSYQAVVGGSTEPLAGVELKAVGLASGDRSARAIEAGGHAGAFESVGATRHAGLTARWLGADSRRGAVLGLTASSRAAGFEFGVLSRERTDRAYGARLDGDLAPAAGPRLRAGLEVGRFVAVTDGTVPATPSLAAGSPVHVLERERATATHAGAYVEAEQALGRLVAVAGLRADRLPGEERITVDPRGALALTAGDWTLRTGAGVFHQGRWRRGYRLPGSGAPEGIPTRARHLVAGAERAGEPSLRVEAYMKRYDDYVPGEEGALEIASATTRGLDAIVRWQRQERLNGWVTYSVLDARLDLADGGTASATYDVTHTATGVGRLALGQLLELGSTIRYATGRPHTPVIGTAPAEQPGWPEEPVFGPAHSERVPDYFRVDARITRYARFAAGTGVFYLEMLALTGRRNVLGYRYDATYSSRRPVESFFARRTFVLGAELQF